MWVECEYVAFRLVLKVVCYMKINVFGIILLLLPFIYICLFV